MKTWDYELRNRLDTFIADQHVLAKSVLPISIKTRVVSGCFHREHSPSAYEAIDDFRANENSGQYKLIEHENGPEILTYVVLGTTGINFTVAVINLISAIIKARNEGVKKGDKPKDEIEIIVRGFDTNGILKEETILRINNSDKIKSAFLKEVLDDTIKTFIK